ncbi:MAG: hypothetical protein JOZ48_21425 [Acidobacteriaceae bacterium]|nr:hypothetical protein [Acidobacteriaceae bacterium]
MKAPTTDQQMLPVISPGTRASTTPAKNVVIGDIPLQTTNDLEVFTSTPVYAIQFSASAKASNR